MSLKQMYDAIIFTEVSGWHIPVKTIGAYKIAQSMRERGYKVKVINNFLEIWDSHREELLFYMKEMLKPDAKFIGISGTFATSPKFMKKENKLVRNLKDNNPWNSFVLFLNDIKEYFPTIPVVLGGHGNSSRIIFEKLNPENKINYWVDGLAEESIHKFLKAKNPPKRFRYDILGLSYDFHNSNPVFTKEDGIMPHEVLPLELSRGCRFKCKFCSFPLLGKNPNDEKYLRSEKSIYNELKRNYEEFGTTKYNMLCDTFNETTKKLEMICRVQEKLKIQLKFSCYLRIDLLNAHKDQINLLHEAGLNSCHFGIESFNHESAKAIGKGLRPEKIKDTLHRCKEKWENSVLMNAGFITGLPHETPDTMNAWCQDLLAGKYELDTWYLNTLAFFNRSENAGTRRAGIFSSEFEKDPKKYGYTFPESSRPTAWKNDVWTQDSAKEMASSWRSRWENKIKVGSWHAMSLQSYNIYDEYYWNDILKLNRVDLERPLEQLEEKLVGLKTRYIEDYWKRLIT